METKGSITKIPLCSVTSKVALGVTLLVMALAFPVVIKFNSRELRWLLLALPLLPLLVKLLRSYFAQWNKTLILDPDSVQLVEIERLAWNLPWSEVAVAILSSSNYFLEIVSGEFFKIPLVGLDNRSKSTLRTYLFAKVIQIASAKGIKSSLRPNLRLEDYLRSSKQQLVFGERRLEWVPVKGARTVSIGMTVWSGYLFATWSLMTVFSIVFWRVDGAKAVSIFLMCSLSCLFSFFALLPHLRQQDPRKLIVISDGLNLSVASGDAVIPATCKDAFFGSYLEFKNEGKRQTLGIQMYVLRASD